MMRDAEKLYPFTVRLEDGREFAVYAAGAQSAAGAGQARGSQGGTHRWSPAVLVLRADEPFVRRQSRLRRLLNWWESR